MFDPTGNTFESVAGAQKQTVGVFAYGGGADLPILNHVSLRAEYRGLVYSAPDFGISERRDQRAERVACEDLTRIGKDQNVVACARNAGVERR